FEHEPVRILVALNEKLHSLHDVLYPLDRVVPCALTPEDGERHAKIRVHALVVLPDIERVGKCCKDRIFCPGLADASRDGDYFWFVFAEDELSFKREDCGN